MTTIRRSCAGVLQKRAPRSDGFTRAKRALFLDMLAETCNVTRSAAAAGINRRTAASLRQRDGGFAQLWDAAIAQGLRRLDEELVARALGDAGDENPGSERNVPAGAPFDPALALQVLKMHAARPNWGRPSPAATQAEIDAILIQRLNALAKRAVKA